MDALPEGVVQHILSQLSNARDVASCAAGPSSRRSTSRGAPSRPWAAGRRRPSSPMAGLGAWDRAPPWPGRGRAPPWLHRHPLLHQAPAAMDAGSSMVGGVELPHLSRADAAAVTGRAASEPANQRRRAREAELSELASATRPPSSCPRAPRLPSVGGRGAGLPSANDAARPPRGRRCRTLLDVIRDADEGRRPPAAASGRRGVRHAPGGTATAAPAAAAPRESQRVSLMALLERSETQPWTWKHAGAEEAAAPEEEEKEKGGGAGVGGRCCVCVVQGKGAAFIPCAHHVSCDEHEDKVPGQCSKPTRKTSCVPCFTHAMQTARSQHHTSSPSKPTVPACGYEGTGQEGEDGQTA